MPESVLFIVMFLILFFGAGGILLKLYVLDKVNSRKLFDDLARQGFHSVDIHNAELFEPLKKFKLGQNERERSDVFQYAVAQDCGNGQQRYFCDMFRKKEVNQGRTHIEHYTLFIDKRPISVKTDIFIRPKYPAMVEAMMHMQMSKEIADCLVVTDGLTDAFQYKFEVIAKPGNDVILSQEVQALLLQNADRFPLNQIKGRITPMIHICTDGYSFISNRMVRQEDMQSLLRLADGLSIVLNK